MRDRDLPAGAGGPARRPPPSRSGRCGTGRHRSPGLPAAPRSEAWTTAAPVRRCSPRSGRPTGTSGSGGPSRRPRRAASSSGCPFSGKRSRGSFSHPRTPPDQASARPPLNRQARRCPVRFRVGRVDHREPGLLCLRRQFGHDRGKHAHPAPPLPAVAEGLRRAADGGRGLSHPPVALDEEGPAQHPPVIDPRLATGLRKERPQLCSLCVPVSQQARS
mgnify:CR=1 FL=1